MQCWGKCQLRLRAKFLLKQQSVFLRDWGSGLGVQHCQRKSFQAGFLGFHPGAVFPLLPCAPGRQRPPFPHTPALAALGIFQALLTGLGVFQGCCCSWSGGICKAEEMESAVFLIKQRRCLNLTHSPHPLPACSATSPREAQARLIIIPAA